MQLYEGLKHCRIIYFILEWTGITYVKSVKYNIGVSRESLLLIQVLFSAIAKKPGMHS